MPGLGGMGMGGMGSFSMNYSPEQMPHGFRKISPSPGKQEISPSMAQIGQSKFKGGMGAGGMALRNLATEGLSFAAMGAGPGGMMAMSAFSMAPALCRACVQVLQRSRMFGVCPEERPPTTWKTPIPSLS